MTPHENQQLLLDDIDFFLKRIWWGAYHHLQFVSLLLTGASEALSFCIENNFGTTSRNLQNNCTWLCPF
jgi:hypothetical protein